MKDESQNKMETVQKSDESMIPGLNGRMSTRKHPLNFGRSQAGPNLIQNEASNDMSMSMNEYSHVSSKK
jgi:hypothetical protein